MWSEDSITRLASIISPRFMENYHSIHVAFIKECRSKSFPCCIDFDKIDTDCISGSYKTLSVLKEANIPEIWQLLDISVEKVLGLSWKRAKEESDLVLITDKEKNLIYLNKFIMNNHINLSLEDFQKAGIFSIDEFKNFIIMAIKNK